MEHVVSIPSNTPKSVTFVLTVGIEQWVKSEAARRARESGKHVSFAVVAREVFEKAMRESEEGKAA